MANKTVHQIFNNDAVKHFDINCDPYGIMVNNSGLIETVYIDESNYLSKKIDKILEGKNGQPDMKLYKKAFLFPNSPISQERVKSALKEHKITLTNDYNEADLYLTHYDLSKDTNNGENISSRAMLGQIWNFDAIEDGHFIINEYCELNSRNGKLARVIYDNKVENFVSMYNATRYSMPYDCWLITGLAINAAYEIEVNNKACYDVEKIMHQSATKTELTKQMIDDIVSQVKQGHDGIQFVGAILPTIDFNLNYHLQWVLAQEIGCDLYRFNRNKDVQYWLKASDFEDYKNISALDMIHRLENREKLDKIAFKYLEPIVRKEIRIENRDLYTFRVEVKPEYKKLMI
tara:strand:- start:6877 stop:7914 length:1038 start_codon:yes stop_codon:yes gene_type:complete